MGEINLHGRQVWYGLVLSISGPTGTNHVSKILYNNTHPSFRVGYGSQCNFSKIPESYGKSCFVRRHIASRGSRRRTCTLHAQVPYKNEQIAKMGREVFPFKPEALCTFGGGK